MSILHQPGQHPDADQLSAFVEHALPPHEREQTLAHLSTCQDCRSIVALSMPEVEETLPAAQPTRKSWFSGWRLAWTGAIAVPVLTCLVILALHNQKAPENIAVVRPQPVLEAAPPPPQPTEDKQISPKPQPPARIAAKVADTAPVIATRDITNLPLEGRNRSYQPAPAAPSASPAVGGIDTATAQTASPVSTQADGNANGQPIQPVTQLATLALRRTESVTPMAPLPSNHPIVSTAANGTRVLALDTENTLFRSEDSGQHWTAVSPAWTGRVLRVDLAGNIRRPALLASAPAAAPKALSFAAKTATSLSGTITDASGAAIPGATVVTAGRTVKTDAFGYYAFANLPDGTYTLVASSPGFQTLRQTVTSPTATDLTLPIGSESQTVTVSSASNQVELISTPSIGQTVARVTAPTSPSIPVFELSTESGEHWTSSDGVVWTRK